MDQACRYERSYRDRCTAALDVSHWQAHSSGDLTLDILAYYISRDGLSLKGISVVSKSVQSPMANRISILVCEIDERCEAYLNGK